MDYKVDIVMCIDITGSMQDCIDTVKSRALQFWPDLQDALKAASKQPAGEWAAMTTIGHSPLRP